MAKSFSPILIAFVPMYALWPSPIVLLVSQVVLVGLGGFPLYWHARRMLGPGLALTIGLAFYLFPGVHFMLLTQFHEIVLEAPILALGTFFLLRRHTSGFLVCLAIALLIKEEVALIMVALGGFVILVQRNYRLGFAMFLGGVVWTYVVLQWVIPYFRGGEFGSNFYYFDTGMTGGGGARYSYLGRNFLEILMTVSHVGILCANT